ncbi:hypothetical protein RSal33209_3513 [Renibacterium salmoninarum ATCC 33209]|uniref:Uncharacterized protein n=1 Tax=Renibacterium salmoninarum (strain ATCC 33209 / DSM 20767 / JCM 11484 / NBRC 15589 / NCIMB 2235) TaxID=288705 RepID=A9WVK1_RENSM|nr:hypothetical protein [Renibacterium salmoninarum]ABY25222.1 hypothetical protein RSal33209_3513 [Renibacterium salmoninarum ATCC 33209]
MPENTEEKQLMADFGGQVSDRLSRLAAFAADGGLDDAVALITESVRN